MKKYLSKPAFVELIYNIKSGETINIGVEDAESGEDDFYAFESTSVKGMGVTIYESVYGTPGMIFDGGFMREEDLLGDIYDDFFEEGWLFIEQ